MNWHKNGENEKGFVAETGLLFDGNGSIINLLSIFERYVLSILRRKST